MPRPRPNHPAPRRRAFSLGEVILALAVLALSVVSMLGLIGPALNAVKQAQDINAGTLTIQKMNAILDAAPFYDTTAVYEGVYSWVYWSNNGNNNSPTIFIFYTEIPQNTPTGQTVAPVAKVVRYNASTSAMNTPASNIVYTTFTTLPDFVQSAIQNRIRGPVIALTLSPSPLMKNFPQTPVNETTWYSAPVAGSLFPSVGDMPVNPNAFDSRTGLTNYPEGYLPILVQAFTVSLDGIDPSASANSFGKLLVSQMTANTRLFTYTTAKLR